MPTPLEQMLAEALALRVIDEFIGDDTSREKSIEALREFERQTELEKNRVHY